MQRLLLDDGEEEPIGPDTDDDGEACGEMFFPKGDIVLLGTEIGLPEIVEIFDVVEADNDSQGVLVELRVPVLDGDEALDDGLDSTFQPPSPIQPPTPADAAIGDQSHVPVLVYVMVEHPQSSSDPWDICTNVASAPRNATDGEEKCIVTEG